MNELSIREITGGTYRSGIYWGVAPLLATQALYLPLYGPCRSFRILGFYNAFGVPSVSVESRGFAQQRSLTIDEARVRITVPVRLPRKFPLGKWTNAFTGYISHCGCFERHRIAIRCEGGTEIEHSAGHKRLADEVHSKITSLAHRAYDTIPPGGTATALKLLHELRPDIPDTRVRKAAEQGWWWLCQVLMGDEGFDTLRLVSLMDREIPRQDRSWRDELELCDYMHAKSASSFRLRAGLDCCMTRASAEKVISQRVPAEQQETVLKLLSNMDAEINEANPYGNTFLQDSYGTTGLALVKLHVHAIPAERVKSKMDRCW